MSTTTDFIAELIRAANEIHTLTSVERVRLIERAAATIQAQRDLLTMRERIIPLSRDVTADLGKLKQEAPNFRRMDLVCCSDQLGDEVHGRAQSCAFQASRWSEQAKGRNV